MKKSIQTDVVIIGAGPAGCGASFYLSKFGINHVILEKEQFPRDKICGDALSGKITNQLRRLDPAFLDELNLQKEQFTPSWGVVFSSPNGDDVAIPFRTKPGGTDHSPGYIAKRIDFDHYLFKKINPDFATVLQNEEVNDVLITEDKAVVISSTVEVNAKLVLSAEGTRALVAKKFTNYKVEREHFCAGLRAYYTGVKDLHKDGFIELHFVEESLPGYFWIFPLPNGQANVGIGMLSSYVSKNKVNLKELMLKVIESPKFKSRFEGAELQDKILGWGLPLGSKKRKLSGDRFMLLGDSGSLIDPFTGEGIGNAMFSGKWAAEQAQICLADEDFSAKTLKAYDETVYRKLGSELKVSTLLQRLIKYPWLFNWMIRKIKRNDELRETITFMFEDVDLRKKFSNPLFYLRILFK